MQYRDPQDCTYEELEEAIKHGRQDVKYLDGEQFKLDLMKMVAGQLYPGADKLPDDLAELLCAFTDEYIFVYLETYRQEYVGEKARRDSEGPFVDHNKEHRLTASDLGVGRYL